MIQISQPEVIIKDSKAFLQNFITINNNRSLLWFSVDEKYKDYLCYERSDAYVIAILNYAMRNNHDIVCEAPISEDLYYNIDKYLIDALCKYNKNFYRTKITAPVASDALPNAGAVGTGISCGVDSLHALASQTNLKFKRHNITHLCFNNVGSHGEGKKAEQLFAARIENPKKFAEEYGYDFILSNSNLMEVIPQNHYKTHTYSSMFPVYCLQKLYHIYYYASAGYSYKDFHLEDIPIDCCGSYEMLSLPIFSTHQLRIYSEGEGMDRMDKLKDIVKFSPSYKYLNVCLEKGDNCGKCEKCIRTMLGLYALDKLDLYNEVFDVNYFKKHKNWYLKELVYYRFSGKHDYYQIYKYLKKEIPFYCYIIPLPRIFKSFMASHIHNPTLRSFLKKLFVRS